MKKLISLLALGLSLSLGLAQAEDKKEPTAQQNKMSMCNKEAGEKKGDERKAFMKSCLSNKPAEGEKRTPQQNKMAHCNKEAGEKKGDERKQFMSECLKAK